MSPTRDDAGAAQDDGPTVIMVTANRREEDLQEVAVSVATLSLDQVQSLFAAGADTTALAARVPGLFVESSNGRTAPRFYIRGLGNTDFDLAASQPVSVVMDDVVMENVTLKSFPLFDVERVEVLRGPQGTLFGRNTPAGIVRVIDTARPTQELTARGSVSLGSYGTVAADAARGRFPIVEDLLAMGSRSWRSGATTTSTTASPRRRTSTAGSPTRRRAGAAVHPGRPVERAGDGPVPASSTGRARCSGRTFLGPGDNELNEQLRPRHGVLRCRRAQRGRIRDLGPLAARRVCV